MLFRRFALCVSAIASALLAQHFPYCVKVRSIGSFRNVKEVREFRIAIQILIDDGNDLCRLGIRRYDICLHRIA